MPRLIALLAAVSLSSTALAGDVSAEGMGRANRAASKVVKKRLETERPQDFAVLQKVEKADVVVVSGSYDHVQTVLASVGVPHVVVDAAHFSKLTLNAKQLLILNCGLTLDERGIAKVRKFVNAGGFLYTTDWALSDIVQKAFPGYVKSTGRSTANDVVEVQVKQTDSAFLKHLQLAKESPKWWLEGSSEPIRVLNPKKVEVLIASREMKRKYGQEAIAVTFPYGDGRVLHMASHFYMQQNQTRTVAEKKKGEAFLNENSTVSKEVADSLAKDEDLAGTTGGNLSSAYAAQQMTSNLVIERKKDQSRIDKLYSKSLKKGGARVKVVETRGEKLKVRTMAGQESWVEKDAVN